MSLWSDILLVIQEINQAGGNFTSSLLNRSVIDLLDQAANAGDAAALSSRNRITRAIKQGKWPLDHDKFNAIVESYHEGLFYLLARHRGVTLRPVPEVRGKSPDFAADAFGENYEVKILDLSGGSNAYPPIVAAGLAAQEEAQAQAQLRGIGSGVSVVNPHGGAQNWLEVMQRVIRQIGANVKQGQFEERPTLLVVALPRTSIHSDEKELQPGRKDPVLGKVNGHLWTIAAHKVGDHFWWPDPDYPAKGNDNGPLNQNGVLRDYPFVRAIVFVHTIRHQLGSADFFNSNILDDAYRLHGVWNDKYKPVTPASAAGPSSFHQLCHASVQMV